MPLTADIQDTRLASVPVLGSSRDGDWFAFRPLVETLGLDVSSQYRKIRTSTWAKHRIESIAAMDGQVRSMMMVDVRTARLWLTTLDLSRAKPASRGLGAYSFLDPDGKLSQLEPRAERQSLVYFIHAPAMDMVKIGISIDVAGRLQTLQNMSPAPIYLLGTEPGGLDLERELHCRFGNHRSHGEWFHMVPEIENYISSLAAGKELAHV